MNKQSLLFIGFLLFSCRLDAQTQRNENWDLMIVLYFSGGMTIVSDSVYTFRDSTIDKVEFPKYQEMMEKKKDSISVEWFKKNRENKQKSFVEKTQLEKIQFFVKPRRIIRTKDTFFIEIKSAKGKRELILEKKIVNVNESFRKDPAHPDYIPLFNVKFQKLTNIRLLYSSSDRNLQSLGHSFEAYSPSNSIRGIYPLSQKSEIQEYYYRVSLNSLFSDQSKQISKPKSKWQEKFKNAPHDTVDIDYKIIVDTINSKEILSVTKEYYIRPKKLVLSSKEKSIVLEMSIILDGNFYQYQLIPWDEAYEYKEAKWINCSPDQHVIEIPIKHVGEYVLHFKNTSEEGKTFSYGISVKPQWFQTLAFKIVCISLGVVMALVLLFSNYRRKQKKKMALIEKQKTELDVSLNSMRSQRNPHFIFNALNSIQGLISSGDYDKASEYLVHFSSLLRKPLNRDDLKHWTLDDEITLLNTYIKLEQLRTAFSYFLHIDKSLLPAQISFPPLLLQPLAENAIKHGLTKVSQPELKIQMQKHELDLIATIRDNGKGFKTDPVFDGNGLKLSKEYVKLINKQFPESHTSINFESDESGTTIFISFQNWLDD